MIFLGIDPGASGGIACIRELFTEHFLATAMPETERDVAEQVRILAESEAAKNGAFAIIEAVHSMPGQGVASSFKFGMSYGALRMALIAAGIPFEAVTPQRWQKAMGCLSRGDKNVTKRKAQELFPGLKVTHATADALLLAEYGRRLKTGELK